MSRLPDKLSDLLELAVNDARAIEGTTRDGRTYVLEMGVYHWPTHDSRCLVCMAGAVMARTLECPPDEVSCPSDYQSDDTWKKLKYINAMRTGSIPLNVGTLYSQAYNVMLRVTREYAASSKGMASWEAYLEAARGLRELGL